MNNWQINDSMTVITFKYIGLWLLACVAINVFTGSWVPMLTWTIIVVGMVYLLKTYWLPERVSESFSFTSKSKSKKR